MIDNQLETIDDLAAKGQRLAIRCADCGRFRYMNSGKYAGSQSLDSLSETLICGRCRSRNIKVIAVSRDPNSGYWPAEEA